MVLCPLQFVFLVNMSPPNTPESRASTNDNHNNEEEDEFVDSPGEVLMEIAADATIANILDEDKGSKQSKEKTALSHFNDFLRDYWQTLRPNQPQPIKPHEALAANELDTELFGCFASYLVGAKNKTAKKRGDEVFLSLNSAVGYFSAVKMHYIHRKDIRKGLRPRVFDRDSWHELSSKLTANIVERHKASGTPLVNPKAAANTEDWKALASICGWIGEQKYLEFWCIFVALVHMAARGKLIKMGLGLPINHISHIYLSK